MSITTTLNNILKLLCLANSFKKPEVVQFMMTWKLSQGEHCHIWEVVSYFYFEKYLNDQLTINQIIDWSFHSAPTHNTKGWCLLNALCHVLLESFMNGVCWQAKCNEASICLWEDFVGVMEELNLGAVGKSQWRQCWGSRGKFPYCLKGDGTSLPFCKRKDVEEALNTYRSMVYTLW